MIRFLAQDDGWVFLAARCLIARRWKVSGTVVIEFQTPPVRAANQRSEWVASTRRAICLHRTTINPFNLM
jgi:hypothetical protein